VNPSTPTPPSAALTEVSFRQLAYASTTGIFILMGAVASLFGPLLISFGHRFHLSVPTAGVSLSVYFVGATLGAVPGWQGLRRLEGRRVLRLALLAIAAGSAGAALSRLWPLFLASLFLIGLGFGALDISLNTLLARTSPVGRARRLSIPNAGYGIGAVICPLVIIALAPHNFPILFAGLGGLAVVLSASTGGVHAPPQATEPRQAEISMMRERRPILVTFVVAYIFYVALETSSSGWMATQLRGVGFAASIGSIVTAGFWLGLAVGRLLGGPLHHWLGDRKLVLGGLILAAALTLVARADPLAPFVYPLLGLILASVFPMGLIWYTKLCPHDSDGLSLLIIFMMIGGVGGPGVVSLAVSHFGVHAVPFALATFAAVDLALFLSALRFRPLIVADGKHSDQRG